MSCRRICRTDRAVDTVGGRVCGPKSFGIGMRVFGAAALEYYKTVPADGYTILTFTVGHAAE